MQVHSLFILKEGGVCLYSRQFSEKFKGLQVDLITPFFSAIFSFSNSVLSKQLEILEMSDLRFVFKKEKDFIFIILSDASENLLFINSRLDKIINQFFRAYKHLIEDLESEVIENPKFDEIIDSVMLGADEMLQLKRMGLYQKIVDYLTNLISQNEIIGAALLTTKGTIIYSTLTSDILMRSMRELEIRYMTGTFDLPELFYTLGNGQKVCERIISYANFINLLLIIQFTPSTQLGMVDFNSEMIVEKLIGFMK